MKVEPNETLMWQGQPTAQLAGKPGHGVRVRQALLPLLGGFVILAASAGCSVSNTEEPDRATSEDAAQVVKSGVSAPVDDESEVIQDLINQFIIPQYHLANDSQSLLVIWSESYGAYVSRSVRSAAEKKPGDLEMMSAYVEANKLSRQWPTTLRLSRDFRLIHETGEWQRLQEQFPRASEMICISRPGFSEDRRRAMVFFELYNGPRGGGGHLITMQKTDEGWQIDQLLLSVTSF